MSKSKKHLEDALQAGQQIAASGRHDQHQHQHQHQPKQQQQHQHQQQAPAGQTRTLDAGPSIAGSPEDEGVFALRYVDGGRRLVVGTGAEGIRCLAADFQEGGQAVAVAEAVTVKQNQPIGGLAITCISGIRSHPSVILAASTSGYVYKAEWDSPGFSAVVTERGNHLSAMDTTEDLLATVGSDCCVRLYDARTCQPVRMYSSYRDLDPDCPEGHATRLFAARFNADGLLLTAGWDSCVKFWDPRLASSDPVKRLSGPHVCSPDGLDVKGDRVLTGSYRPGSALQLWDARQCEQPLTAWPVEHVYCARFTACPGTVAAAGALSRSVTVWHIQQQQQEQHQEQHQEQQPIGSLELDSAAYCMATTDVGHVTSKKGSSSSAMAQLAIGCHSGRLQLASLL